MHTCAQLHKRIGRTLVPPSATLRWKTGLKSLLRFRVSSRLRTTTARALPRIRHTIHWQSSLIGTRLNRRLTRSSSVHCLMRRYAGDRWCPESTRCSSGSPLICPTSSTFSFRSRSSSFASPPSTKPPSRYAWLKALLGYTNTTAPVQTVPVGPWFSTRNTPQGGSRRNTPPNVDAAT